MGVEKQRNGKCCCSFGVFNVHFGRFFDERRNVMRRVILIMCLVVIVGSLSASAAIDTAWFRFEDGSAGGNIGTLANSGTGTTSGNGVDWYSTDGLQPVYSSQVPGPQIQDGLGGAVYSNGISNYTPPTTSGSSSDNHGSGYLAIRNDFGIASYYSTTIECFYMIPNQEMLAQAESNTQHVWFFNKSNHSNALNIEVRHQPGGNLEFVVGAPGKPTQYITYTGFTAGQWHHIAMVFTDSSLSSDDFGGNYEPGKIYAYVDYQLVDSKDIPSAPYADDFGYFGAWPWWDSDHWELQGGREKTMSMGYYDEIRLTYNSHGSHLGGAALTPDQFLRAVPEPASVGLMLMGALGLWYRKR